MTNTSSIMVADQNYFDQNDITIKIKLKDALDFIESYRGKNDLVDDKNIVSIRFVKTDKSIREMNCRIGYDDGNLIKKNPVDFKAKGLICVYDVDKSEYRSFKISNLIEVKHNNLWKKVVH